MEEGRNALELGDEILGLALSLASLSLGGGSVLAPLGSSAASSIAREGWTLPLFLSAQKVPDSMQVFQIWGELGRRKCMFHEIIPKKKRPQ